MRRPKRISGKVAFASYLPDAETLSAIAVPVQVLTSEQSRPFFGQAARRLAERLHVSVSRTGGTPRALPGSPA
ncbi:MAG: hypothetical protein LC799_22595 [Actinobacteria bacterium]|nr:hypothetical protein [Actinomycetota bacterium]